MINLDPNKIYVAFHKGDRRGLGNRAISQIIKIATRDDFMDGNVVGINENEYSHTELIYPRFLSGDNRCFSSRGTAKPSGVAFKNYADIIEKNPTRWDFLPVDWVDSWQGLEDSYKVALSLVGKKYAYNNVINTFSFIQTRKDRKKAEDWWCSECNAYALSIADYKVSPNRLYTLVYTMNHNYNKRV